jgi:hypothetical protein
MQIPTFRVKRGEKQVPRQAKPKVDNAILEMAIVGYQSEVEKISTKIADLKAQLGQRGPGRPKATAATPAAAPPVTTAEPAAPAKRRTISKAGRARIAAAQRARWAAQKTQQAPPATPKSAGRLTAKPRKLRRRADARGHAAK